MAEFKSTLTAHVLKRLLKNDMREIPGQKLTPELRGEFTRMLKEKAKQKTNERTDNGR